MNNFQLDDIMQLYLVYKHTGCINGTLKDLTEVYGLHNFIFLNDISLNAPLNMTEPVMII